ncbi:MAG: amino acid adenylation domain-containing protein, partial [Phenylobacterium sp.]
NYVFDTSIEQMAMALLTGSSLVVISEAQKRSLDRLDHLIDVYGITHIDVPASLLAFINNRTGSSLKRVVSGGEETPVALYRKFKGKLINEYGPTETCVASHQYQCLGDDTLTQRIPIGKPLANTRCYVLSPLGQLLPIGAPGELYIGGVGLARGYLHRAELTREKFIDNPFANEADIAKGYDKLYKTGDLVRYLPDGNLVYLGRIDEQVKIRGYRIELGEIENGLMAQKSVRQAVVVALEHAGSKVLAAYVVSEPGSIMDVALLRAGLVETLPEYMIPAIFTPIKAVPLTINGKLDKKALPQPQWIEDDGYVAPRNALEAQLCTIWQQLLGLGRVGIEDNFFGIGGNSINAIKLTAISRRELGLDIALALLFSHSTIGGLSQHLDTAEVQVIPHVRCERYPLSFAQARLLFIERFEQGTDAYHIPMLVRLTEAVNMTALLGAFNVVADRHVVMKTVFRTDDNDHNYQQKLEGDLSWHTHTVAEDEWLTAVAATIAQPFDLSVQGGLQLHLYVTSAHRHLLMLWHHMVSDEWSDEIFVDELNTAYQALLHNKTVDLPPLDISYGDYALWQRQYLQGDVLAKLEGYWQQQLAGFETLNLATDHERPTSFDYEGANDEFVVSRETSNQLRELARAQNTTLYTVLLSGFYVMLASFSGQDDIVIGTPSDNRHQPQTQQLIGFFVNTLVLRGKLDFTADVEALIGQVHQLVNQGRIHQDLPFERVVDLLGVERELSRHPVFQVLFSFYHRRQLSRSAENQYNDLPFIVPDTSKQTAVYCSAKFDLSLDLMGGVEDGCITGNLNYATSLFSQQTIARMGAVYQKVLGAFVDNSSQWLGGINLLSEQDRYQLFVAWNQTDVTYPDNPEPEKTTLHQLFEAQAEKSPDSTALVFESEALSYRQVNEKANQLARVIQTSYQAKHSNPICADTLIALYFDRSLEMVISILAVLKAGGAYVPISPEYPKARTRFVLEDTAASILLSQSRYCERLIGWFDGPNMITPTILVADAAELTNGVLKGNLKPVSSAEDLAYVIYTSGTSGQPKGVMVMHKALNQLVCHNIAFYQWAEKEVVALFANYVFDTSIEQIAIALFTGSSLIVISEAQQQSLDRLDHFIDVYGITHIDAPASLLALIDNRTDSSLRRVVSGGEETPVALYLKFKDILINEYGPTETCVASHQYRCCGADTLTQRIPIGKPLANTRCYVLSPSGQPLPIGAPGELHIGGAGLARGYLNRPELTREKFIDNPFATAADLAKRYDKLYKTGDLVHYLPDGNLVYLGRIDEQVKVRGYRIEPGEIENALMAQESVRQAVVVALEQTDGKVLAAYVVSEPGAIMDDTGLRAGLAETLPEYMIPASFNKIDQVPLTINGKLDKQALPQPQWINIDGYVAPRNPLEAQFCTIWQQLLGLERIGVEDNFFRIGGDSILAIRLVLRLSRHGFSCQVKTLFEAPTVAGLVSTLSLDQVSTQINPEQGILTGTFALLPIQQAFFAQRYQTPHHWNQAFMLRLPGVVGAAAIAQAINAFAVQHDILRCTFEPAEDGGYCQRYHSIQTFEPAQLQLLDIADVNERQLHRQLTDWQSDFNYLQGPLWRVAHLSGYSDGSARLFLAFHHLIIDVVSWHIIAEDIQCLLAGQALGDKGSSYRQWVAAIQAYNHRHPGESAYWQAVNQQMKALPTPGKIDDQLLQLTAEQTDRLLHQAGSGYYTRVNDLLLSALAIALKAQFGRDVNHITLEGHGRETIDETLDLSRTLGWFTSLFPVALTAAEDVEQTIIQTKEMLRCIPNNGVGYGALSQRGLLGEALPAISFNYLGQLEHQGEQGTKVPVTADWSLITTEDFGTQTGVGNEDDLLLNINGAVKNEVLSFDVSSRLPAVQGQPFADAFKVALLAVIDVAVNTAKAGGMHTPGDYSVASLSVSYLKVLQARYDIDAIYPVTSLQQRFIDHHLSQPTDDAYRVQLLLDYHLPLDLVAYQQAWRLASIRYPILRTAFDWQDNLIQITDKRASIDKHHFSYIDISEMPEGERETAIARIMVDDRAVAFDFTRPGLVRFTVIKQKEDLYSVLNCMHHSITDGWSGPVLQQTVHDYYDALVQGRTPAVVVEQVYWQVQQYYLKHQDVLQQYWQSASAGFRSVNNLDALLTRPIDLTRARVVANPQFATLTLVEDRYQRLKASGQRQGVTLNVVVQFAWHKLLQVYTSDEQTIVGTMVSGREVPVEGIESSVGLYINTLPLAVNWSEKVSISTLLMAIHQDIALLNTYSAISLATLQHGDQRLFHSVLVFQNYPSSVNDAQASDTSQKSIEQASHFRQGNEKMDYPLAIVAYEQGESLYIRLDYDETWLDDAQAGRILSQLNVILDAVANDPEQPHDEIELLSNDG